MNLNLMKTQLGIALRLWPHSFRCTLLAVLVVAGVFMAPSQPLTAANAALPQVVEVAGTVPTFNMMPVSLHFRCLMRNDGGSPVTTWRAICYGRFDPGPLPDGAYYDPPTHTLLQTTQSGQTASLEIQPCQQLIPGVHAQQILAKATKPGTSSGLTVEVVVDTTDPFTCSGAPVAVDSSGSWLAYDTSHDEDGDGCSDWNELGEDVALGGLNDPFNPGDCGGVDTDGDGCPDAREIQTGIGSQTSGGLRDPLNPWDFYDVEGFAGPQPDGFIDLLTDILPVIQHYQPADGGAPPYDAHYDRGGMIGPYSWNKGPPDGVIDLLNDILGVITQYGHDCR